MKPIELSIVMPCLNEAATVATCIGKALACMERLSIAGEVVVADNGSTDGSQEIARAAGARVVPVTARGYGAALKGGIAAAQGRYVIMGDADDSYDFSRLDGFVAKLRAGYELVMGNRFKGGILPGAMPFLHRYLGNPVLSFLGRLFFQIKVGDFHCGLRGFDREAIGRIGLSTSGMEFASEMIVKSALAGLRIAEVPTTLAPDGRGRAPHLRTWRDGWRHLRFLLAFSPRWLFLYPGFTLLAMGVLLQVLLFRGGIRIGAMGLDIHTMLYSAAMMIIGVQMVWFAVFAKVYGISIGILPRDIRLENLMQRFTLERGLVFGLCLFFAGIALSIGALHGWSRANYGELNAREVMRIAIPAVSLMVTGSEFVLASFFLSVLRAEIER